MELLKKISGITFLIYYLIACGFSSKNESDTRKNVSAEATGDNSNNNSTRPDYSGMEELSTVLRLNSLILDKSYFYGYIPTLNAIGKLHIDSLTVDSIIKCGINCNSVKNLTIPTGTQTLIIFNENSIKGFDLITETFFELPSLTIKSADHYFSADQTGVFGFLDRQNQKINLFRVSHTNSSKVFEIIPNINNAGIIRTSEDGKYLVIIDTTLLNIEIWNLNIHGEYEPVYRGLITDLITASLKETGHIVDGRFSSEGKNFLIITAFGHLINLKVDPFASPIVSIIENINLELFLGRLNPTIKENLFFITYLQKNSPNFGYIKFELSKNNKMVEKVKVDLSTKSEFPDNTCLFPLRLLSINEYERLISCAETEKWVYMNDKNPSSNEILNSNYTEVFNLSSTYYLPKNQLIQFGNNPWGEAKIYSLTDKTINTVKDFLLDDFFR